MLIEEELVALRTKVPAETAAMRGPTTGDDADATGGNSEAPVIDDDGEVHDERDAEDAEMASDDTEAGGVE